MKRAQREIRKAEKKAERRRANGTNDDVDDDDDAIERFTTRSRVTSDLRSVADVEVKSVLNEIAKEREQLHLEREREKERMFQQHKEDKRRLEEAHKLKLQELEFERKQQAFESKRAARRDSDEQLRQISELKMQLQNEKNRGCCGTGNSCSIS